MKYIITSIILILIDYIYLINISNQFNKMINNIQNEDISVKFTSVILCYIFLIIGINYFIIKDNKTPNESFLLGAIIYGVYATTNYALINNWEPKIALIDTIWGGILFYLTTYISYYISNKYL
jgi:uncharacterized membrane protein